MSRNTVVSKQSATAFLKKSSVGAAEPYTSPLTAWLLAAEGFRFPPCWPPVSPLSDSVDPEAGSVEMGHSMSGCVASGNFGQSVLARGSCNRSGVDVVVGVPNLGPGHWLQQDGLGTGSRRLD